MRKLFALIFSVLMICACATTVSAAEAQYSTAGALYEDWYNSLPDYICGVWSTDGGTSNLTFGIQKNEAGNAGKQEILELVENDSSVTFVYQEFSRNYLLGIQKEIDEYFEKDLGLISTGLDDINNCIVIGILKERTDNADTQNMIAEITEKYGHAVSVEYTDKILALTIGENKPSYTQMTPYTQQSLILPMVMMIVLLSGVVFVIAIRKKMYLLQTNHGTSDSTILPPSSKDVVDMIKESNYDIPADLKQKVMTAIDGNE